MKHFIVVIALLVTAGTARAEDATIAAAKTSLAAQVKALSAGDVKAFAATFSEKCFALLPEAALEAAGKDNIEKIAKTWLGRLGSKPAFTVKDAAYGKGTWGGWYFANLVVGSHTFRVTGVIGASHDVVAVDISEGLDDAAALKLATDKKLPAQPKLPGDLGTTSSDFTPEQIGAIAWEPSGLGVAIGSAPGEVGQGKSIAGYQKIWKTLHMKTTEAAGLSDSDDNAVHTLVVVAVHLTIPTSTGKGKPTVDMPFRALIAGNPGIAGNDKPWLLVAHFSIAAQ